MLTWEMVINCMHHRLQWFIHLQAQCIRKGDQHPTETPLRGMACFTFYQIQDNSNHHTKYTGVKQLKAGKHHYKLV